MRIGAPVEGKRLIEWKVEAVSDFHMGTGFYSNFFTLVNGVQETDLVFFVMSGEKKEGGKSSSFSV